jgi:hypothetical protein
MFILTAEPKELTIVLILGPIKMEDLGKLKGLSGLGSLGDISVIVKEKDKDKDKEKNKDKTKVKEMSEDKKDGAQ